MNFLDSILGGKKKKKTSKMAQYNKTKKRLLKRKKEFALKSEISKMRNELSKYSL